MIVVAKQLKLIPPTTMITYISETMLRYKSDHHHLLVRTARNMKCYTVHYFTIFCFHSLVFCLIFAEQTLLTALEKASQFRYLKLEKLITVFSRNYGTYTISSASRRGVGNYEKIRYFPKKNNLPLKHPDTAGVGLALFSITSRLDIQFL